MFKKKAIKSQPFVSMIVVAAGSSSRMGENKLLMEIWGEPVLAKTLKSLDNSTYISEIVLVCRQSDIIDFSNICKLYNIEKPVKIVSGGQTRTHSAFNGMLACDEKTEFIGIHDAARPLATSEMIDKIIQSAFEKKCVIPVVPVKDTIKVVSNGICVKNLPRETLFSVQTPQVFSADIIKNCTKKAFENNDVYTDDSSCVETFGYKVYTEIGDYDNIKITTPEDISLAMLILDRRGTI